MNKVIMILILMASFVVGYGIYSVYNTANQMSEEIEMNNKTKNLYYEDLLNKI